MPKDRLFSSSIDTLSILLRRAAGSLPRDDSLGVPRARGASPGRGLATAVGGIALYDPRPVVPLPGGLVARATPRLSVGVAAARAGHRAYASGTVVRRCHGLYRLCLRWSLPRAGPLSAGPRVPRPDEWDGEKELQIRAPLQHYGANDSLSYFATRRDKQVIFPPTAGRPSLPHCGFGVPGLQRPRGRSARLAGRHRTLMLQARSYGWVPAALSVSEAGARAYSRAGLSVLQMGEEAVLETDRFTPQRHLDACGAPGRSACATRRVRRADSPLLRAWTRIRSGRSSTISRRGGTVAWSAVSPWP